MSKFIVGGLAVVGGVMVVKAAGSYILTKHKKEIKAAVLTKVVGYFCDEEDEEDPMKIDLLAFANAYSKKGE